MEVLVLDTNFKSIVVVDVFESLIWTDRYCGYGDFEIYTKASKDILSILVQDYYLWMTDSEHVMIIEDCKMESDVENGNKMLFTGRSLESIPERRIIWTQTVLSGNLQNGIEKLLNENIISPTMPERVIPNFIFEPSTDPIITGLTIEAQIAPGANLYETIDKICSVNDIGFKITLSESNKFIFKLYAGADRSYGQLLNPYVVFSPKFENIISTNYLNSKKSMKNVTLVAGEGEDPNRKTTVVGTESALSRREMFTDANDISQTVDDVALTDEEYIAQLQQKGLEDLSDNSVKESFDGQVDTTHMFVYGEDFYMGDIVQLVSEYGIEGKARVTELIHSQSTEGIDIYPTFTMIE
jgi:hypothetical protein